MTHDLVAPPPLSTPRKVALASGDLGMNLYWQSITYFLLFFYTDILGIDARWAGLIYMVASIFDGIIDPIAGHLMDITNTRWGRYRPWIAAGTIPLALSFMLIYWSPSLEGTMLIVFVTAAHLLFRVCYTVVAVPIASLSTMVTRDSRERSSLTGMRIMFALAGGVVVATATRPLARLLGTTEALGFFWVAALSGCAASIIYMIVIWNIREPAAASSHDLPLPVPLARRWASARSNGAFLALAGGLLGATLAITIVSKSVVYYFKYVLQDEAAGTLALSIITASSFLSVPLWTMFARRYGKRTLWLVGVAVGLTGLGGMALVMPTRVDAATIIYVTMQVGIVAINVAYWAMLPDTVEYGHWRTGVRLESFLVGLFMFVQKLGLGVAAGVFGWSLGLIGLHGAGSQAAASVAAHLPWVVVVLAAIGFAISGACVLFSPLRNGVHERVVADLTAGASTQRAAGATA